MRVELIFAAMLCGGLIGCVNSNGLEERSQAIIDPDGDDAPTDQGGPTLEEDGAPTVVAEQVVFYSNDDEVKRIQLRSDGAVYFVNEYREMLLFTLGIDKYAELEDVLGGYATELTASGTVEYVEGTGRFGSCPGYREELYIGGRLIAVRSETVELDPWLVEEIADRVGTDPASGVTTACIDSRLNRQVPTTLKLQPQFRSWADLELLR